VEHLPGSQAEAGRGHDGNSHAEDDEACHETREPAKNGPADEALAHRAIVAARVAS
jgi:hypothetical protein